MPNKCCAPNCRSNYKSGGPKISTFAFPKDPEMQQKWIAAIKRNNFSITNNSRVCELHFQDSDIERVTSFFVEKTGELFTAPLKIPRLVQGAIPSKLPGCPEYLSKNVSTRVAPEKKCQARESQFLKKAISESLETANVYKEEQSLASLDELFLKFSNRRLENWNIVRKENYICFLYIEETPYPSVISLVSIDANLEVTFSFQNVKIKTVTLESGNIKFPLTVSTVNHLEETLSVILNFSMNKNKNETNIQENINLAVDVLNSISDKICAVKQQSMDFVTEQIKLINVCHKNTLRYSWETLLFCSLLHSISPQAYKFLRNSNILTLPSSQTLKNICSNFRSNPISEQDDTHFLQYIASKFKLLNENDKLVILMLDEIHLKPYLDYKGGNIVGNAYNSTELATSAHVFMVSSIKSGYKDVAHILPVKQMNGNNLYAYIKKIILGLEDIGFEVFNIVTDNNALNRRAMTLFANPPELKIMYEHPKDPSRPLFFCIDTVHILKNFRNNWLNQKPVQNMVYPDPDFKSNFHRVASFDALKELHSKEKNQLLKYGYTLSLKALYPTSIERQNVKLVLQIFTQPIITALREFGPKVPLPNFEDTAAYIEMVTRWWQIVNVKTMFKGQRSRNIYQEPITKESYHIFEFLENFLKWLKRWELMDTKGKLTKETHFAVSHTTEALLKISSYLLNEKNFNFVLLGKIQTDNLEERFGKYRYLAGCNYHVSLRQIFESENKLRLMSMVPLIIKSKKYGDIKITKDDILGHFEVNLHEDTEIVIPQILRRVSVVDESSLESIPDNIWPSLIYIAGYASYSLQKKIKCDYCKIFLTEEENGQKEIDTGLITANDRGGLCYPNENVAVCCAFTYLILENLLKCEEEFLKNDQRKILVALTLEAIYNLDRTLFIGLNCQFHKDIEHIREIVHSAANILLKNYTKKRNDVVTTKNMPQLKRLKH